MSLHVPLRRMLAAPLAAAALLVSISGVAAAPSLRATIHQVHLAGDVSNESAYLSFQLTATGSGDGANVMIWLAPDSPIFDPPTLVGGSADFVLGPDDSSMSGTVDLAWAGRFGGNHKLFTEQTIQPLAVTGTLTIPARSNTLVVPLQGATATASDHVEFSNAPSSTVDSTKFIGMFQLWQVDDVVVAVLGEADTDISYIEVAVFMADGTVLHGSDEDAVLTHRSIGATVMLASQGQGLAPASGTVTIDGTVSKGDVTRAVSINGDDRVVTTVQHYAAVGSLTLSLDDGRTLTLDLAAGDGSFYGFAERTRDGGAAG